MNRNILFTLILGLLTISPFSQANDQDLPDKVDQEMVDNLTALDEIDYKIASIQMKLENSSSRSQKRKLKDELKQLQTDQKEILERVELRLFGPKPITILDEPKRSIELWHEKQRQQHEAILESNIDQRLPTN